MKNKAKDKKHIEPDIQPDFQSSQWANQQQPFQKVPHNSQDIGLSNILEDKDKVADT